MLRKLDFKGFRGRIRIGGREAATFKSWKMKGDNEGFEITADCASLDPFLLDLDGVPEATIVMSAHAWRWKDGKELPEKGPQAVQVFYDEETSRVIVTGKGFPEIIEA